MMTFTAIKTQIFVGISAKLTIAITMMCVLFVNRMIAMRYATNIDRETNASGFRNTPKSFWVVLKT